MGKIVNGLRKLGDWEWKMINKLREQRGEKPITKDDLKDLTEDQQKMIKDAELAAYNKELKRQAKIRGKQKAKAKMNPQKKKQGGFLGSLSLQMPDLWGDLGDPTKKKKK